MSAEEVLRENENSALEGNQFVSSVGGKSINLKTGGKKLKSLGAAGFITAMIVVVVALFGSGNLLPAALSDRLLEETDVQYADAVESKKIVFQQALLNGELPKDTVDILKKSNVLVGYEKDGNFVETNKSSDSLSIRFDGKTISAKDFIKAVNSDARLYNAFNDATYSRAAYYYDDSAREIFKNLGTSRNNYTSESDFDEVMNRLMGSGSNVSVGNVAAVEEDGVIDYQEYGDSAISGGDAANFIASVRDQNRASTTNSATLNSADSLKVADTIAKEQRSSLFFLGIMENISKMKAGEGNESKINEAMNYLSQSAETEVVDVETGEVIKLNGSALDSPSLYAILSGSKSDEKTANNFSSDRVLTTVKNRLESSDTSSAIRGTVSSSSYKVSGSVGRLVGSGSEGASGDVLGMVEPTISSSLVDNSYETIKGINAGEFLVEGAVNVGKYLAKASGASAGDAEAVNTYARLNNAVLAMDAKADRLNRSPFDITSKNTFLGSIMYNFAITMRQNNSFSAGLSVFANTTKTAVLSLSPSSYADASDGYLTEFGKCETYSTIGAVGSMQCSEIATFDTTTLNDPFNDSGFKSFVEENTTLSGGTREINDDSVLAKYILYNNNRITPLGVVDGGILESLAQGSSSVSFVSSILSLIQSFIGASDGEVRVATGEEFLNSKDNSAWQTYKYAQRYVSLARATEALRQYSDDSTAYSNIRYFEGNNNPVIAFMRRYYNLANK